MTSPSNDASTLAESFFRCGHNERPIPTPGLDKGTLVGDFRLEALLGQGGMGQVWEARQESLARQVAIKFVRPERVTEHQLQLFAREARAGGRLSHTGIVAVYEHGKTDDLAWIAMELIPGAWDLRDFLDEMTRAGEVPPSYDRKVAQFIAEVADAVQAAHDSGVIHRDLKPQNILISEDDRPKVTDFGLARILDESALSATGDFAGTYFYMSPEQVAARRIGIDHRTDIFSLGIVLYEMLSLVRPFQGDTEHQVAEQILILDPPDPRSFRSKIPRDLAVITHKALEKDRSKRYESMTELAEDLRRWLENKPIHATPPTRIDRAVKWCKRNPTKSIAGALTSIGTVAITALLFAYIQANEDLAQKTREAELYAKNAQLYVEEMKRQEEVTAEINDKIFWLVIVREQQDKLLELRWNELNLNIGRMKLKTEGRDMNELRIRMLIAIHQNKKSTLERELQETRQEYDAILTSQKSTGEPATLNSINELRLIELGRLVKAINSDLIQLATDHTERMERVALETEAESKTNIERIVNYNSELREKNLLISSHLQSSEQLQRFNSELSNSGTSLTVNRFSSAGAARRLRTSGPVQRYLDYDAPTEKLKALEEATLLRAEELKLLREQIGALEKQYAESK